MTYTFNLNKQQLLTRILQLLTVIDYDAAPTPEELSYASDMLNMYIKWKEATGMTLWKRRLGYLFPAYHTASYDLGSAGWHCTNSYVATTLSSAASSGTSTISLTAYSGMSASDYIGIELDDGTRQWTTISGTPGSTTTLATTLTGAASSGNTVITYTSKLNRPLRILRGTLLDLKNNSTEVPISKISYDQYFNQPNKNIYSDPCNMYYDKILQGSAPYTGKLYLFPSPSRVSKIVTFSYHDSLADLINSTDSPDFPQEWLLPLMFMCAVLLAPAYGKDEKLQTLAPQAQQYMDAISEGQSNSDDEPIIIKFDPRKRK